MKSSRHLISAAAEFSSRMEHGENHGDGGHIVFFVDSGGNSAAVVGDPDDVAGENVHLDVCAVSGKSLIYGVVDDFVNKVMKSALAGRADIHTGALSDGLKTLQHLNLFGVVLLIYLDARHLFDFHFITS